ncbi:SH3 domain-containing protein [Anaerotalea alkaliphila]|uniref:SH3 domain-containing protein n=1 Tax=Anaerotalea alkaliphila TaxID=2662126 RepID=A0A7X5KN77_9FIRM|nr:SH3 domain-containing protein [Anaerotalea alkaliphila]NDL68716.1 SH3 domain-containing protein [Anaerotalea alkaliphila]
MSSKSIYGFEISGMQRMLESMSPVLKSVQMSNAITAAMPTSMISQQLFDATQPLREATERWNQIFNTVEMTGLRESLMRTSNLMGSSSMIEASNNLQRVLKSASLQMNLSSTTQQLNLGFDPRIFETIQRLSIDTSTIEKAIQNNLKILRGVDWSSIIDAEDFEDFNVENSLDSAVIDLNDGVSFQEQIAEFINRFKTKNPVLAILIVMFVFSPVQAAINDAVRDLVKGVTTPIIEQAQTNDYKVIEKNMKIEVNNTLIINVESKDVRDEFMKIYGYVSTEKLVMRQTNKVKSNAIHTLEFGQIVRIIHKDRNWTLVEYESEGEPIQGWVFTRYISKFKK